MRKHSPSTITSRLQKYVVVACCTGLVTFAGLAPAGDAPDEKAIRDGVTERLKALRSIVVESDVEEVFSPEGDPATQPASTLPVNKPIPVGGGLAMSIRAGTDRHSEHFYFLDGNARWESVPSEETIKNWAKNGIPNISTTDAYFPGVAVESLTVRAPRPGGGPSGRIGPATRPPEVDSYLALGLGLRETDFRTDWLTPESLASMRVRQDADGNAVFEQQNSSDQLEEHVFAPKLGYAQIAYRRRHAKPPHAVMTEAIASDFRRVDDIDLPFLIVCRNLGRYNQRANYEWKATVRECHLGDQRVTVASLQIAWPLGRSIFDSRTGTRITIRRDGQTLLDDELRHK